MGSSCGPMMKSDDDYRAEDDHRTMTRAAEIQSDKGRMAGVRKQHRKMTKQHAVVGRQIASKR